MIKGMSHALNNHGFLRKIAILSGLSNMENRKNKPFS